MAIDVERLMREIDSLSPDDRRRIRDAISDNPAGTTPAGEPSDLEYQERLVQGGLMREPVPRQRDQKAFEAFQPVPISGKPLSQTILEDRR